MLERGLSSGTVRRTLKTGNAVLNLYFLEKDPTRTSPFVRVAIPDEGEDAEARVPFASGELVELLDQCKAVDDDVRWLIAMLADTGARLAEIAGLPLDDIVLDYEIPHVVIQSHPWRSLKTKASKREVPLTGHALWAAKRLKANAATGQRMAFPRYTDETECKATHASNTIAKWIRSLGMEHTAHELRHTMADRLRDVQCPEDIRLAIGGWAVDSKGNEYGKGYRLRVRVEWLAKIT
jgi:integrase